MLLTKIRDPYPLARNLIVVNSRCFWSTCTPINLRWLQTHKVTSCCSHKSTTTRCQPHSTSQSFLYVAVHGWSQMVEDLQAFNLPMPFLLRYAPIPIVVKYAPPTDPHEPYFLLAGPDPICTPHSKGSLLCISIGLFFHARTPQNRQKLGLNQTFIAHSCRC